MKRIVLIVLLLMFSTGVNAADRENLYYSLVFPGWGQVKSGHYAKGSLFLGAELVSLLSIAAPQIQYNRAVEQYDRARTGYLNARYIGDAVYNYNLMRTKWDDAERLYGYRKALIGTAIGVYIFNIVDMVFFSREERTPLAFSMDGEGFLVTTGFSF